MPPELKLLLTLYVLALLQIVIHVLHKRLEGRARDR